MAHKFGIGSTPRLSPKMCTGYGPCVCAAMSASSYGILSESHGDRQYPSMPPLNHPGIQLDLGERQDRAKTHDSTCRGGRRNNKPIKRPNPSRVDNNGACLAELGYRPAPVLGNSQAAATETIGLEYANVWADNAFVQPGEELATAFRMLGDPRMPLTNLRRIHGSSGGTHFVNEPIDSTATADNPRACGESERLEVPASLTTRYARGLLRRFDEWRVSGDTDTEHPGRQGSLNEAGPSHATEPQNGGSSGSVELTASKGKVKGKGPRKRVGKGGNSLGPNKRAQQDVVRDETGRVRRLACPFSKLDPASYQGCINKQLATISRVKEHVRRVHLVKLYCPSCYMVFKRPWERDSHVREGVCKKTQVAKFVPGYNPWIDEHENAMTVRASSKRTVFQQWGVLYGAFFPGAQVPEDPWVQDDLLDIMVDWRRFIEQVWPGPGKGLYWPLPEPLRNQEGSEKEVRKRLLEAARLELIKRWVSNTGRPGGADSAHHPVTSTLNAAGEGLFDETQLADEAETLTGTQLAAVPESSPSTFTAGLDAVSSPEIPEWLDSFPDGYSFGTGLDSFPDVDFSSVLYPDTSN